MGGIVYDAHGAEGASLGKEPVIIATDVGRLIGERPVLEGVSLEVHAGEVLGLIGPNGGGKSTLLLVLAGLVQPTSGEVLVDGIAAHELAHRAAGRVGLLAADPGLYPLLTGRENLHWFGGLFGRTPAAIDAATEPLLTDLGVLDQADRRVHTYSSGMKQKFSLARALLLEPVALLLDEPTSNLDPAAAWTLYEACRQQAKKGVAVVLCTHDLHAAERFCDRVVLLDRTLRAEVSQQPEGLAPQPGPLLALYQEHCGG